MIKSSTKSPQTQPFPLRKGYSLEGENSSSGLGWLVQGTAETLKTSEHWGSPACWTPAELQPLTWRSGEGLLPMLNKSHKVLYDT